MYAALACALYQTLMLDFSAVQGICAAYRNDAAQGG